MDILWNLVNAFLIQWLESDQKKQKVNAWINGKKNSIKKTRTEYALYKGTSTEPIVSVKYDTGMSAEAVATLFIRTVEAITGVALNP